MESIKWIPGTKFIVDGFRFQSTSCQCYFLTHCHADHTCGTSLQHEGPLLCPRPAVVLAPPLAFISAYIECWPLGRPDLILPDSILAPACPMQG